MDKREALLLVVAEISKAGTSPVMAEIRRPKIRELFCYLGGSLVEYSRTEEL